MKQRSLPKWDAALDRGADDFSAAAKTAAMFFGDAGLNVFVFTSDLEYSLVTEGNKAEVIKILSEESGNRPEAWAGFTVNDLRRQIGSKLAPFNPLGEPKFKKPFLHRKIAATINLTSAHQDIGRLLSAIKDLGKGEGAGVSETIKRLPPIARSAASGT